MKTILLIGKLTNVIQSLNEGLSEQFNVQICPDSIEVVKDMMRTLRPNLVILSIVGWEDVDVNVFDLFCDSYPNVSVLIIGTESGRQKIKKYYENDRFLYMESPIGKKQLMDRCRKLLNLKAEDPKEREEEGPGKKHILVVDDNPVLLRSVKAMLDKMYKITVSTSGEQALKMIEKSRPDLILLDYEMPGYDGKKTLEIIRGDEAISDIPVIFLTGVADKEAVIEVLELKPEGYILKPPARDKMLEKIKEVFDKKQDGN